MFWVLHQRQKKKCIDLWPSFHPLDQLKNSTEACNKLLVWVTLCSKQMELDKRVDTQNTVQNLLLTVVDLLQHVRLHNSFALKTQFVCLLLPVRLLLQDNKKPFLFAFTIDISRMVHQLVSTRHLATKGECFDHPTVLTCFPRNFCPLLTPCHLLHPHQLPISLTTQ